MSFIPKKKNLPQGSLTSLPGARRSLSCHPALSSLYPQLTQGLTRGQKSKGKKLWGKGWRQGWGANQEGISQPCVTSGLWRHQQDGTCNLSTPSTTFGETASYPGLTPPHLLLLTGKTEGSPRAGPLPWASPHLWLRRYGFRSQTFLEFSTFLIFPKS